MAKRSQPALYELIRDRSDASLPVKLEGIRSTPTRPLSIAPVTAWCALAVALGIVIVAYMYGFSQGERAARARIGQQASSEVDRLANANGRLPPESPGPTVPESTAPSPPAGSGNPAGGTTPAPTGPAVAAGDPRVEGLNYFVLAQVPAASGDRMVEFCRERDLDAHSVPDDTGGLRFVIVTPGFAGGDRRSEPVLRLEAKIRSVGLQWKSAARGNRDFSDFYPRKFAAKAG